MLDGRFDAVMKNSKILFFLVFLLTLGCACSQDLDYSARCETLKKELKSEQAKFNVNYDLVFTGYGTPYIEGIKRTSLFFGDNKLEIPFVGEDEVRLEPSIKSTLKKGEKYSLLASYYKAKQYNNVKEDLFGLESDSPLFNKRVYQIELVMEGMNRKLSSLSCKSDKNTTLKNLAYILSKATFSSFETKVKRMKEYRNGFILYHEEDVFDVIILQKPYVLIAKLKKHKE